MLLVFVESKTISDALWKEWLAAIASPQTKSMILGTDGPLEATTAQWRDATKVMKDRSLPVVVLSDDRRNAALAKKAAWLGAKIKSFRWDTSLYDPLLYLGCDIEARRALKPAVFALRDYYEVGAPKAAAAQARPQASVRATRKMPAWMLEDDPQPKRELSPKRELAAKRERSPKREHPEAASKRQASEAETARARQHLGSERGKLTAEVQQSRDAVFRSSSDIQAKLAEVQARLRARNLEMQRTRS